MCHFYIFLLGLSRYIAHEARQGQYRYKSTAKLCQYAGGSGAAGQWPPARPKPQETGFHAYHAFAYHTVAIYPSNITRFC